MEVADDKTYSLGRSASGGTSFHRASDKRVRSALAGLNSSSSSRVNSNPPSYDDGDDFVASSRLSSSRGEEYE